MPTDRERFTAQDGRAEAIAEVRRTSFAAFCRVPDGRFGLAYLACNTIMNLTTQDGQVLCLSVAQFVARPRGLRARLGRLRPARQRVVGGPIQPRRGPGR
jgi:hypothetical protein